MPPLANIPGLVSLRYYDADRDYQAGIQHSKLQDRGRRELRLELPAVLNASIAKSLVEAKDNDVRYTKHLWTASLTNSATPYQPSDKIMTPDGRKWQIAESEVGLCITTITAKLVPKYRARTDLSGAAGRHVAPVDLPIGDSRISIVDLPLIPGGDPNKPAVAIFAAGTQAGWRRAALSVRIDQQWTDIGGTAPPAIMGETLTELASHPAYLVDAGNEIEIALLNPSMELSIRDSSPLTHDAPLFWIGGEFVRVGCIADIGANRYRLSRLSRGCFALALHAPAQMAGTRVILMDAGSALMLADSQYILGQTILLEAQGLGDADPVSATSIAEGKAITPLSPVHGRAVWNQDGSVDCTWKRRSRLDLGWVGNVDQAQVEQQESYRVALYANDMSVREWVIGENILRVSAQEIVEANVPQNASLWFSVRQIGRFAQSDPLLFSAH